MSTPHNAHDMDRRTFLKAGTFGAVAAAGLAGPVHAAEEGGETHRVLGRTGLKVSVVGIGAMRTTEPAIFQAAFDRGVNYLDTAHCYQGGNNEKVVGEGLKGYRDKVYVATKFHYSRDKNAIFRSVEGSLQSLKTDHIDVLQMHNPSVEQLMGQESREAVAELKKQGKIRFAGVTTHKNQADVLNALVDDKEKFYDTVLVTYNFKGDEAIRKAIERAGKAKIGVIAMKTQAGGYKTDAMGPVSPHQAALKWVLQNPNIHTAVPAMVNLAQVKEDTEVIGMRFTAKDKEVLSRYGEEIDSYYCRMCGQCEGTCRGGVDICTVNRALMYADGYGDMALARSAYGELPVEQAASACLDCARCAVACPNNLDIRAKMRRAKGLFA